jgi:hypothetical protein
MSKQRSNFTVFFLADENALKAAGKDRSIFDGLAKNIISLDLGAEDLSLGVVQHRTGRMTFWLNDDEELSMIRAVRELQALQLTGFSFVVAVQNWVSVGAPPDFINLDRFDFYGCRLEALQHSLLSYEDPGEDLELYDRTIYHDSTPRFKGKLSNNANRSNSMKLLQVSFESMEHHIPEKL